MKGGWVGQKVSSMRKEGGWATKCHVRQRMGLPPSACSFIGFWCGSKYTEQTNVSKNVLAKNLNSSVISIKASHRQLVIRCSH